METDERITTTARPPLRRNCNAKRFGSFDLLVPSDTVKTHVPIMRPRDADIPKGLQGDLTLVIADLGGARVVFRHPMEDAGINDPQFQTLPVLVRIQGLSDQAADDIAAMLDDYPGHLPLPPRSDLFGSLPHTV